MFSMGGRAEGNLSIVRKLCRRHKIRKIEFHCLGLLVHYLAKDSKHAEYCRG